MSFGTWGYDLTARDPPVKPGTDFYLHAVGNWLKACDFILGLNVEAIVPGHGPITDKAGVRKVQEYLKFIDREARNVSFHG